MFCECMCVVRKKHTTFKTNYNRHYNTTYIHITIALKTNRLLHQDLIIKRPKAKKKICFQAELIRLLACVCGRC